jgi:enoyl-CoA hydratase/carnithine racemase
MLEVKEGIGYLVLNRPEVLNAISRELTLELNDALQRINADFDCRVLIITGSGRAFQAGADIKELSAMSPVALLRWNEAVLRNHQLIEKLRQPVIAAINGIAMGGGLELALACCMRVAVEGAKLALPEVKLGLLPGTGGTQRLPRLIGKARAYELLLTGKTLTAEEAKDIGLVNQVVPRGEAVTAAAEVARQIMANAPIAVELCKDAVEVGLDLPLEQANQYAQKNCVVCFSTDDMREGTSAFLEKREPYFKGK